VSTTLFISAQDPYASLSKAFHSVSEVQPGARRPDRSYRLS
jgi:hypothetical protein